MEKEGGRKATPHWLHQGLKCKVAVWSDPDLPLSSWSSRPPCNAQCQSVVTYASKSSHLFHPLLISLSYLECCITSFLIDLPDVPKQSSSGISFKDLVDFKTVNWTDPAKPVWYLGRCQCLYHSTHPEINFALFISVSTATAPNVDTFCIAEWNKMGCGQDSSFTSAIDHKSRVSAFNFSILSNLCSINKFEVAVVCPPWQWKLDWVGIDLIVKIERLLMSHPPYSPWGESLGQTKRECYPNHIWNGESPLGILPRHPIPWPSGWASLEGLWGWLPLALR